MTHEPTVYVVEDDDIIRDLVAELCRSVGFAAETFESGDAFLAALPVSEPGCIILDVRMPGISGLELQGELQRLGVTLPVIIITAYGSTQIAVRAMKAGAHDFVEKPIDHQLLLDAVNRAVADSTQRTRERTDLDQIQGRLDRLTARERDVLGRLVEGLMNKQIAHDLGITQRTVEVHRSRIMEKMEARSLAGLLRDVLSLDPLYSGKP